jgi:hypothetical protein
MDRTPISRFKGLLALMITAPTVCSEEAQVPSDLVNRRRLNIEQSPRARRPPRGISPIGEVIAKTIVKLPGMTVDACSKWIDG